MEWELKEKNVCGQCIGEDYLRAEIFREGVVRPCSYCTKARESYTVGKLAERIEEAFERHYVRLTNEEMYYEEYIAGRGISGDSVVDAIGDAVQIDPEIAEDVQKILGEKHNDFGATGDETEFSSESYYQKKGIGGVFWELGWTIFEEELNPRRRGFLTKSVEGHLSPLFNNLIRSLQSIAALC